MNRVLPFLITLCLCVPVAAGERSQQRFLARATAVIQATPLPCDANGVAFTRTLRLSMIPVISPFGATVFGGRSAAFRLDEQRRLVEPRLTRHAGAGLTASMGVGIPLSGSISREVRSFNGSEYADFTTQRFTQASVKAFAGVGVPGRAFIAARGPTWGASPPGTVTQQRELFIGAFAAAGGVVEVRSQWPMRRGSR